MSQAVSAAIRRRGGPQAYMQNPPTPSPISTSTSTPSPSIPASTMAPNGGGYTIQQIIYILDKRVSDLEKQVQTGQATTALSTIPEHWNEEIDTRFHMLATEMEQLKTMVMNLQNLVLGRLIPPASTTA